MCACSDTQSGLTFSSWNVDVGEDSWVGEPSDLVGRNALERSSESLIGVLCVLDFADPDALDKGSTVDAESGVGYQ